MRDAADVVSVNFYNPANESTDLRVVFKSENSKIGALFIFRHVLSAGEAEGDTL